MSDIRADGNTRSRVEKIASYVIQFVAIVTSLQIGRMWVHYPWHWYLPISVGVYISVLIVAWIIYRAVEKVWTYSRQE